jgi:HAD superfamily hydrolase (TIGR01509 family)
VFDLDGVLIDSERVWDATRRAVVAEGGGRWPDGATQAMLGMNPGEWERYLHDELGVAVPPRQIGERVLGRVLEQYRRSLPLLPGAQKAVRTLSKNWPLGLATSSNRELLDEVLRLAGLSDCFAVTVSSEEVGRGKPAPDVYLAALRRLGATGACSAAIEDSSNGLRSAAAAGMHVIAVPNRDFPPSPDALELAEIAIPSLERLTPKMVASLLDRGCD